MKSNTEMTVREIVSFRYLINIPSFSTVLHMSYAVDLPALWFAFRWYKFVDPCFVLTPVTKSGKSFVRDLYVDIREPYFVESLFKLFF